MGHSEVSLLVSITFYEYRSIFLIGGSQTSILLDLETIWTHAVENLLGIPKANLESYRAVLIIPAMFKRKLLKHYMTLLLVNMGFGGAFLIQDHVASTFGAGQGKNTRH